MAINTKKNLKLTSFEFDDIHIAQCLNHLKITGLKLCLLINFSKPGVEIKRIVRGLGNN